MTTLSDCLWVSIGAVFGALCRYFVGVLSRGITGTGIYGTILVNIVGSFVIGILSSGLDTYIMPTVVRPLLITGYLGSLTTFSSFSLEFMQLSAKSAAAAMFYFLSNIVLGFFLSGCGLFFGSKLMQIS